MSSISLVHKITVRDVAGKIDPKTLGPGVTPLFDVGGVAENLGLGQGTYGEWTSLLGQFEARRPDGSAVKARKCFLPEPIHSEIVAGVRAKLNSIKVANEERVAKGSKAVIEYADVQFVVSVGVKKTDTERGYEYVSAFRRDPGSVDTVSRLFDELGDSPRLDEVVDKQTGEVARPKFLFPAPAKVGKKKSKK